MANIKKKIIAGTVASIVAATAAIIPFVTKGDTMPLDAYEEDITVDASADLPDIIPAGDTQGYSFVEQLSESMSNDSPFPVNQGGTLGYKDSFSYDIPWMTIDFPNASYSSLPVEYVYYETTAGSNSDPVPMYCIDYNAKSPTVDSNGSHDSYELTLKKMQLSKPAPASPEDYKTSTLMLAPILYGYPSFSKSYADLTDAEARWATSMGFKFISGAVYNNDGSNGQVGLKYDEFYDSSMLSGISKQFIHLGQDTEPLTEADWNQRMRFINRQILSSAGFNNSTYHIEYNPSIDGYTPDTTHSGQVMGSIFVMLNGAADIKADNGNFERTIHLKSVDSAETVKENTRKGPFAVTLKQGTMYSSDKNDNLTDALLQDDVLIDIAGDPAEAFIGDKDGNAFTKEGNSYVVPTDEVFYVFTSSKSNITYNLTVTPKTIQNFENAYYQGTAPDGTPTQRLIMYAPVELKGAFDVTFKKETGAFKILKVDSVTGDALNGAEFEIIATKPVKYGDKTFNNGDVVTKVVTADEGYAVVTGVEPSQYIIKETKAPSGYIKTIETATVTVSSSDSAVPTITIKNSPYGSLKIIKYDENTGEKLSGAVFEVSFEYFSGGAGVEEFETDENGCIIIDNLLCGEYVIKEIKAPDGYKLSDKEYKIEISDKNGLASLNVEAEIPNAVQTGKFKISKTDPSKDKPIKASFGLITTKDTYYEGSLIPAAGRILQFSTNSNGMYESPQLPVGTYLLFETSTEDDYILPTGKIATIEITADSTSEKVIEIVNYEKDKYSTFKLYKKDEDTKAALEGAVFEIRDAEGNLVDTLTTDSSGLAQSGELIFGTYYVKEIKAPKGYELIDTVYEVKVDNDGAEASLTVYNKKESGQIKIIKVDALDNTKRIENVSFAIYDENNSLVETVNTDHNGEAISSVLKYGPYTIKEVITPAGYVINDSDIKVTLDSSTVDAMRIKTVVVENTPVRSLKGKLQIVKKDSENKKPIANVEFELYAKEDIVGGGNTVYKKNQLIQELVTDKKGVAVSDPLPFGSYYVIESETVDGYIENAKTYNFTINSDNYDKIQSKTVYNIPTEVVITKLDLTTSKPLSGAAIEIYDEDDKLAYEDVTDKNGEIHAFRLPAGEYTFIETAAPDGYAVNPTVFEFKICDDGTVKGDDTITDKPIEVIITKKDLTTGAPLAGATITIKDIYGKVVFEGTSDINGEVKAMHLKSGVYTFAETAAPDGYVRNPETFEFEIFPDGSVRGNCTITDRPTEVVITKKDLTTGTPLAGATIEIKDSNGKVVFKEVSDSNGEVKAMHLKPGVYTFTETAAPNGYTVNPETFTFELFEDGTVKGDCTITDCPTEVVITKKDLADASPLPGAVIQIIDSNGKLAFEGETDKNGDVKAFKLVPGVYTFKEISAPDGYMLNEEKFSFELLPDGSIIGDCEIYDERIPNIKTGVETEDVKKAPVALIATLILIAILTVGSLYTIIKKHFKK